MPGITCNHMRCVRLHACSLRVHVYGPAAVRRRAVGVGRFRQRWARRMAAGSSFLCFSTNICSICSAAHGDARLQIHTRGEDPGGRAPSVPAQPAVPCRAVLEASPPALPQPAARPRGSGPCAKRVQISARPALLVPVAPRCGGGAAGSWAPNHRASGLVLGWVLFPLLHNSLSCPLPSHPCPLTMGATICKTAFLSRTL